MSAGRKLLLVLLILTAVVLSAAMVAVVRPGAATPDGRWWTGWLPAGRVEASERFAEEITVDAGSRITVRNDVGPIRITGGEPGMVRVSGEKSGFGWNRAAAEERLARLRVDIREDDGDLIIEGRVAEGVRSVSRGDRVELEVSVPPGAGLEVDAGMGRVFLNGVTGHAAVDADMGTVEVNGFRGSLDVDAGMGAVEIRNTEITERLVVDAGMGRVVFEGHPGQLGRIDAGMGSVEVRLPAGLSLDLEAEVDLGRLRTELPLTGERGDRSFRGTVGPGTPEGRLVINAGMGEVTIR